MPKKKNLNPDRPLNPKMSSYSKKQDYLKNLERAAYVGEKTPKQVKEMEEVDAVFEPEVEIEQPESKDWFDVIFGD